MTQNKTVQSDWKTARREERAGQDTKKKRLWEERWDWTLFAHRPALKKEMMLEVEVKLRSGKRAQNTHVT
jgi:hypothetical protein